MPANPVIEKKQCDNPLCRNTGAQYYRVEERVVLNVQNKVISSMKYYVCPACGKEIPVE